MTPHGFQSERRDIWDAPNVSLSTVAVPPRQQSDRRVADVSRLADQNVGTDPINSLRLYHALIRLDKMTALYRYPFEDHGPAANEDAARPVVALGGVAR